jgi:hypothetical protein
VTYKVDIPANVKRDIGRLPPDLVFRVLDKVLCELPSDPNKFLGPVTFPYALRPYSFTLQDKQGVSHWFVFRVDGVDPASQPVLRVVGFDHVEAPVP